MSRKFTAKPRGQRTNRTGDGQGARSADGARAAINSADRIVHRGFHCATVFRYTERMNDTTHAFGRFFSVIKRLRADDGCPWDREQTPLSMRHDLIEEVFEAVEAISAGDAVHAREELGDVLLNAVMIAYMYEQNGDFTVTDALNEITDKLIRRHPHVFAESDGKSQMKGAVGTAGEVLNQWDAIKRNVEGRKSGCTLDEVPAGFPPLLKAYKMQKKASKKGFDWSAEADVFGKVAEEIREVKEAVLTVRSAIEAAADVPETDGREKTAQESATEKTAQKNVPAAFTKGAPEAVNRAQLHLEEEIGDLLFAVVNWARHLKADPATALERANGKFYRRFGYVERKMAEAGLPMDNAHLAQMDAFWDEAKARGE